MKKSIALGLFLFGMINAGQSEFSIQQMITAIEGCDYDRVKDLMEQHQFQQNPELLNRFLVSARDVIDERKDSIAYRDKLAFASGLCLGAATSLFTSQLAVWRLGLLVKGSLNFDEVRDLLLPTARSCWGGVCRRPRSVHRKEGHAWASKS